LVFQISNDPSRGETTERESIETATNTSIRPSSQEIHRMTPIRLW
jgi:hypothetical protein